MVGRGEKRQFVKKMCWAMDNGLRTFYKILIVLVISNQFVAASNHVVEKRSLPTDLNPLTTYKFAYDVQDHRTGDYKMQEEERDGDNVKGVYRVADPDGSMRTIRYTVDKTGGFQATLTSDNINTDQAHSNQQQLSTAPSKNHLQLAAYPKEQNKDRYSNNKFEQQSMEYLKGHLDLAAYPNKQQENIQYPTPVSNDYSVKKYLNNQHDYPNNMQQNIKTNNQDRSGQELENHQLSHKLTYANNHQYLKTYNNQQTNSFDEFTPKNSFNVEADQNQQINNQNLPAYKITQTYHGLDSNQLNIETSASELKHDTVSNNLNTKYTQTSDLNQQNPVAAALKHDIVRTSGGYHEDTLSSKSNAGVEDYQQRLTVYGNNNYKTMLPKQDQISEMALKLIPEEYRMAENPKNHEKHWSNQKDVKYQNQYDENIGYQNPKPSKDLWLEKTLQSNQRDEDQYSGKSHAYNLQTPSQSSALKLKSTDKGYENPKHSENLWLEAGPKFEGKPQTNSLYQQKEIDAGDKGKYMKYSTHSETPESSQYAEVSKYVGKPSIQKAVNNIGINNYLQPVQNPRVLGFADGSQFVGNGNYLPQPSLTNTHQFAEGGNYLLQTSNPESSQFIAVSQSSQPINSQLSGGEEYSHQASNQQNTHFVGSEKYFPQQSQFVENVKYSPENLGSYKFTEYLNQLYSNENAQSQIANTVGNGNQYAEQNQQSYIMNVQQFPHDNLQDKSQKFKGEVYNPIELIKKEQSTFDSQRLMKQEFVSSQPLMRNGKSLQTNSDILLGQNKNIQFLKAVTQNDGHLLINQTPIISNPQIGNQKLQPSPIEHNYKDLNQISSLQQAQQGNVVKYKLPQERKIPEQQTNPTQYVRYSQPIPEPQGEIIYGRSVGNHPLIQKQPAFLENGQDISKSVQLAFQKYYQERTALQNNQEAKSTPQILHYVHPQQNVQEQQINPVKVEVQNGPQQQVYAYSKPAYSQPEIKNSPYLQSLTVQNERPVLQRYNYAGDDKQTIGMTYFTPQEHVDLKYTQHQIKSDLLQSPKYESNQVIHQYATKQREQKTEPQVKYVGWQGNLQNYANEHLKYQRPLQGFQPVSQVSQSPKVVDLQAVQIQEGREQVKYQGNGNGGLNIITQPKQLIHGYGQGSLEKYQAQNNKGESKVITYPKIVDGNDWKVLNVQAINYGRASRQSLQSPHPTVNTLPAMVANQNLPIGYDKNSAVYLINPIKNVPAYRHVSSPKYQQVFGV